MYNRSQGCERERSACGRDFSSAQGQDCMYIRGRLVRASRYTCAVYTYQIRGPTLCPPPAMASKSFSQDDTQLIADLHSIHKKSSKLVKPVKYAVSTGPEFTVESWRMNERKYYDIPSPFPTLARGLFSVEEKGEDGQRYRIVARGYDKFFNIGEVPWTNVCFCLYSFPPPFISHFSFLRKWSSLEAHTKPPHTLTLKSNGHIIFIAALSPSQLLITSKHSLGPVQGVSESHAQAGERWLRRHLEQVGKTAKELAKVLWEKNWTAVAEVSHPHSHPTDPSS